MYHKILPLLCCLAASLLVQAQTTPAQLAEAVRGARPGDTITVANGTYRDTELVLTAKGSPDKPIVVMAQTPGGVILSGTSTLRLAGTGLEVNGLHFTNGYAPKGAVIEFRAGGEVANHCRLTQCTIDNYDPASRETEYSWILLYGRYNRFDHNSIIGKRNSGVTLAVILDEERNQQNHHRIEYNYFGYRPNLGSNGGETIRVGTSQSSLSTSATYIQHNFFEQCNGEVEVVSIKSCDNVIRHNTFYESAGVLALRHGHRNLVEGNAFIGNGKPFTGGLRIINEGHTVRNNFFSGLRGDRFFAALAIMNAVPNSLPNRYHQVKDVTITGNTWVDCDHIVFGVGKDMERTLAPEGVTLSGNTFYNKSKDKVFTALETIRGFTFSNNRVVTRTGTWSHPGFTHVKMSAPTPTPGQGVDKTLCGASWYRYRPAAGRQLSGRRTPVAPGQNTLAEAAAASAPGDILELTPGGEYRIDKSIEIKHYLRLQAPAGATARPLIRYNGSKGRTSMITIQDGGILELQGLSFNSEAFDGKASAVAALAPAAVMRGPYSAFVRDCEFYNFQESSHAVFKAQKGTYADSLVFSGCLFRDMSGDALYLSAEKEDGGKYSAEYTEVTNCAFYKVLGYAVDLYRGGSDESTTGPSILVDHCVLEDVNNKERGSGIRLLGAQHVVVRNTLFSNSGRGGAALRFDETSWDKISVSHCNLYHSGKVASFWGKVITGPMYSLPPQYVAPGQYNFHLKAGSPLLTKASDGKAVGLTTESNNTKSLTKGKL